jgi:hypothetical protein
MKRTDKKIETAILIIGYNRYEEIIRVIEESIKNTNFPIFISIDGSVNRKDQKSQVKIVEYIESLSNERIQNYIIQKINMGPIFNIYLSIDRIFLNFRVKDLIVLEDDCIPTKAFFRNYSENKFMLETGKCNFISGQTPVEFTGCNSLLSSQVFIHGWITNYETWIILRQSFFKSKFKFGCYLNPLEMLFWILTCRKVEKGILKTWDAHLQNKAFYNGMKCLIFNSQSIINVGYNEKGTHTKVPPKQLTKIDLTNRKEEVKALLYRKHINRHFFNISLKKLPWWIFLLIRISLKKNVEFKYE